MSSAMSLLVACSRSDDDLPPPIPLPAAPAPEAPQVKPPTHAPQAEQDPPKPSPPVPTPSASASAAPSASAEPSAAPTVTPYVIPYPLPLPNLPSLPEIPGLPTLPGMGSSSPVDPTGKAEIVIYGTRACPACAKLKTDLAAHRVPYTFIDLENPLELNSPAGQRSREMPATMRNGIPVSRVLQRSGRVVWVQGADAAKVERAYRG